MPLLDFFSLHAIIVQDRTIIGGIERMRARNDSHRLLGRFQDWELQAESGIGALPIVHEQ